MAVAVLAAGCGDRRGDSRGSGSSSQAPGAPQRPEAAPETAPDPPPRTALGLGALDHFSYARGPGREHYAASSRAAREQRWADAEVAARRALESDPHHLAARWLLGESIAAQGRHGDALAPMLAAVAGDFVRFGAKDLAGDHLAGFRDGPGGRVFRRELEAYASAFAEAAIESALFVGRRGAPWLPDGGGEAAINHRSEIYGYHLAGERFLRFSRTDGSAVGLLPSPNGTEVAYAAYRDVVLAEPASDAGAEPSTTIRRLTVGLIPLADPRDASAIEVSDALGAEIFWTRAGKRFELAGATVASSGARSSWLFDSERGAAALEDRPPPTSAVLEIAYRSHRLTQPAPYGIAADWDRAGDADVLRLTDSRRAVAIPRRRSIRRDSLRWSTGRTRLAGIGFGSDACAATGRTSIFVIDAPMGRVARELPVSGAVDLRWLDEERLLVSSSGRFAVVSLSAGADARIEWRAHRDSGANVIDSRTCRD